MAQTQYVDAGNGDKTEPKDMVESANLVGLGQKPAVRLHDNASYAGFLDDIEQVDISSNFTLGKLYVPSAEAQGPLRKAFLRAAALPP